MPGWVWAVLAGVALLVVVDRLVARFGRPDRARRRRTPRPTSGGGAGAFGELVAGLAPSVRHLHEESERQRHDLVQPGDADPEWELDLETGVVLRRAPASDTHAEAPAGGTAGPSVGTAGPSAGTAPRPHACRLVRVAPGVWTATAGTWSSVTTLVVADDGTCLVVDPNVTPAELTGLAAEVAAHGWRVVAGFATHPHWDHVLWSTALGDVPRWATARAVEVAARTHEALVADADAVAPGHDHALTGRLTPVDAGDLPWDGPRAVVVPYPGHCAGSAALLLPGAGVLLAGDALSDREIPLLADPAEADHPLGDYRSGLDVLAAACADVRVLVPGHGTVCDASGLRARLVADRAYLDALASGTHPDDPRLADPEQAEAHHAQRGR